ncbi:MAG: dipeptidase [Bacteroidales bacterium]|nr:dipeptidase [Bacteroidales bacterium]
MQSRRKFIYLTAFSAFGYSALVGFKPSLFFMNDNNLKKRASKIHSQILTLDSHCDTPLNILYKNIDLSQKHNPYLTNTKVDYPRMKEGGLDASFFAVFIGQGKRNAVANQKAKKEALKIFKAIHESINNNPGQVEAALNYSDAKRIEKKGKRAIYIGMENGYPIGQDMKNIEAFYNLGARYITLCHSSNNDICDSSTDDLGAEHNGVSAFGEKVIHEMNRLGIMVDVSHVSDKSFYDAIELSKTPVIASHSSARAVCNHPRNLDDEMLKTLAKNGGVVQLCIYNRYIKEQNESPERAAAVKALKERYNDFVDLSTEEKEHLSKEWSKLQEDFPEIQATVSDAVDHIDHIVNLIGIDHIGIGTDFDGGGGIKGFFDISEAGNLTYELVKRGYSKNDIEKIWGGNFLRVFKEVQKYAGR